MPEVEHSIETTAPLSVVWDFVKEMDNWAPFLTGYQSHEKLNKDESIWVVKGELGGMSRKAEFRVRITEWREPSLVSFQLEGLQEPVTGSGEFLATKINDEDTPLADPAAERPQPGWFAGLRHRVTRWILARIFKKPPVYLSDTSVARKLSRISFRIAISAGGVTGPVLNLLLKPMLKPVAEDLANQISVSVEARAAAAIGTGAH